MIKAPRNKKMDARFYGPNKISQIKPEGKVMEIDLGNRKGLYNVEI